MARLFLLDLCRAEHFVDLSTYTGSPMGVPELCVMRGMRGDVTNKLNIYLVGLPAQLRSRPTFRRQRCFDRRPQLLDVRHRVGRHLPQPALAA